MKRIIALLPLLLLPLVSCKEKEAVEIVNLAGSLYASLLNYQSVGFTVPEDIPLNQDLGSSRTLSFTTRTEPVQMSLVRRGYDFSSLSHSVLHLRMQMEPQNYTGTVEVRIFVSPLVDVFNDPQAVQIAERKIIPAMFDMSGEDQRLNTYLLREDFFIGFQFVLEPSLVSARHVAVAGRIEEFELTVTGSRTLTGSYPGY
ncbi:hypothetical protein LLH00_07775 [bacterium]|nr:hypothetical protein [bacterium]